MLICIRHICDSVAASHAEVYEDRISTHFTTYWLLWRPQSGRGILHVLDQHPFISSTQPILLLLLIFGNSTNPAAALARRTKHEERSCI